MIRAYVCDASPLGIDVVVSIVRHTDGTPTHVLHRVDRYARGWDEIEPAASVEPTFTLGHVEARALLDALHAHYSGVDDTRKLREDHDAERERVNKLTDSVIDLARSLAGKPYVRTVSGSQGFDSSDIMPVPCAGK